MASLRSSIKKQEILRRQLYGKQEGTGKVTFSLPTNKVQQDKIIASKHSASPALASEESYLKKDLLKILYLSLAAFALQGGLYLAISNNLIQLK